MEVTPHHITVRSVSISARMKDYKELIKFRLNMLVIFCTFLGYFIGSGTDVNWFNLFIVCLGGFLTVGAANGLNQIIEKESDAQMVRTQNRPIVQGRISIIEGLVACTIMGTIGVGLIGYFLNATCCILAFTSLMLYAFAYTPLKKISKIAVHVGAIPGAISPLIGYVAATGVIDYAAMSLFVIQFVWQFPHFYAIAWQLDDDYKKVGINLLPIGADKDRAGAIQISLFTLLLLPISFLPVILSFGSIYAALALFVMGIFFFIRSIQFVIDLSDKSARNLMFASFIYLPVVFIIMLIDKML